MLLSVCFTEVVFLSDLTQIFIFLLFVCWIYLSHFKLCLFPAYLSVLIFMSLSVCLLWFSIHVLLVPPVLADLRGPFVWSPHAPSAPAPPEGDPRMPTMPQSSHSSWGKHELQATSTAWNFNLVLVLVLVILYFLDTTLGVSLTFFSERPSRGTIFDTWDWFSCGMNDVCFSTFTHLP